MAKETKQGKLVAVVDDDHSVCNAVSSLVRSANYRCVIFQSVQEFLDCLKWHDIGCILMDISMPVRNGLDLQHDLSAMNNDTPVIFVSANSDDAARERAFRQGAVAFLPKPFDGEDLLNAIDVALNNGAKKSADPRAH